MTLYNVVIPTKKMCGCKNTLAYYAGECMGKKYSSIPEICNKKLTFSVTFSYYKFKLRSTVQNSFGDNKHASLLYQGTYAKVFFCKIYKKVLSKRLSKILRSSLRRLNY